jgi:RHS repeat-associated protein
VYKEQDDGVYSDSLLEFSYQTTGWKDILTAVTVDGITEYISGYDSAGNPGYYRGYIDGVTFENRNLVSLYSPWDEFLYSYNASGIRTAKNINGVITNYVLEGSKVIKETKAGTVLQYYYDSSDEIVGFTYNGTTYVYLKNLQNDIVAIADASGNIIVKYYYDAYGNMLSMADSSRISLGTKNPFRFKSYYYDEETKFYYLNSRYYDPFTGRFINADTLDVLGVDQGSLLQYNLFAYCFNNPVNMVDYNGDFPKWIITGIIHCALTARAGLYGWAQYYFAKGAISAAGNTFLAYKGYSLSREMFNHGMWGYGRTPSSSINNLLISRLKSSSDMKKAIENIMKSATGNSINQNGEVEFTITEKNNADLYYSLQHISFNVQGTKSNGVWDLTITVSDRYDFDSIRSFSGLSFGSVANDLGWAMQRIGMVVPYNISVSYTILW